MSEMGVQENVTCGCDVALVSDSDLPARDGGDAEIGCIGISNCILLSRLHRGCKQTY